MRILVDLDEVLADFVGAALRIHARSPADLAGMPARSWSIVEPLGLTERTFWHPIDLAGEDFWAQLPLLPHALELVNLIELFDPEWYLATTPSRSPSSFAGKRRWITRVFGDSFDRFVFTPHKHLLANSKTVLIDDRPQSVYRFHQAGGKGIIFPTPYNKEPYQGLLLDHLKKRLSRIAQSIQQREAIEPCSSRCSCNRS